MFTKEIITEQKKVAEFIRKLEEELKVLQKSQRAAGWSQRNRIIEHVYSDYRMQEKVIRAKNKWEQITFRCNVLKDIFDLLISYRDIYGLYDVSGMKIALAHQLKLAEKENEFEIAQLINEYKLRFLLISK